jgi:hypothetical protein
LFDLEKDFSELTDLSKNPEYEKILQQMKSKLARLLKQYAVPLLDTG